MSTDPSVPIDDSELLQSLRKLAFEHGFVLTEQLMTIHVTCDCCAGVSGKKAFHEKNISPVPRCSLPLPLARHRKNEVSDAAWPVE